MHKNYIKKLDIFVYAKIVEFYKLLKKKLYTLSTSKNPPFSHFDHFFMWKSVEMWITCHTYPHLST